MLKKKGNPLKLKKAKRKKEDEEYISVIKEIKTEHQFWGYRRVRAYMKYRLRLNIEKKRVYRLMKQNGLLVNIKRYKAKRTPQKSKAEETNGENRYDEILYKRSRLDSPYLK